MALFRADLQRSTVHRVTRPLERLPLGHGRAHEARRRVLTTVRRPAESRLIAANRRAATAARTALLDDPDAFIARLRGSGPEPGTETVGYR
jgi:hypothetical protein